jgi:hypothetical protein
MVSQPGIMSGSGVGSGEELAEADAVRVLDGLGDAPPEPDATHPVSATATKTADATTTVARTHPPITITELLSLQPFMPEA